MMLSISILACLFVSNVYADLTSYSPARGEFSVQSGLAQGYVRYKDENGAERLVTYLYPEPLYGTRRVNPINYEGLIKGTTLLQPQYAYIGAQQSPADPTLGESEENFRTWCEQRFRMLKSKTDKLYAAGLEPSSDMLTQLNTLQSIMTAGNETPEVKRAREEHLRLWNEARLKVLQLEDKQLKLQGEPAQKQPIYTKESTVNYDQLVPVQETLEQQKARDEHFKLYNEQLLRIKQHEQNNLKSYIQQPEQKLAETTYNDFKTIVPNIMSVQKPVSPIQKTTDAQLKTDLYTSEDPLLAKVQYLTPKISKYSIDSTNEEQRLLAIQKLREIERKNKEERFMEAERLREIDSIREEEKQRELERLRDIERRKEEQNLMEIERLRIQLQDDRRAEMDRQNNEDQRISEKIHLQKDTIHQTQIKLQDHAPLVSQSQMANVAIFSNKHENNPLLLRIANQPGLTTVGNYYIAPEKQGLSSKTLSIDSSNDIANLFNRQNPFLIRYIAQNTEQNQLIKSGGDSKLFTTLKPSFDVNKVNIDLKSITGSDVSKNVGTVADSKNDYKKETENLSDLEKATRDHFRAHEIALEQLRLAHTKELDSKKDC